MQEKDSNTDVELFGKHYPELKAHAKKLCLCINLEHLHQDLLHDTIHQYLSHEQKSQIEEPLQWIKFVMYQSTRLPNSTWFRKNIELARLNAPIDELPIAKSIYETDRYTKEYRLVCQHLNAHFDFVEQVLMRLRLQGINNKEISEMLEIPYDTICRINRKTKENLQGKVKLN